MNVAGYDSKYAALYYPWIKVADPTGETDGRMVPPSGHLAGIWARNDSERGVHKAPANEIVRGALGLEVQLTRNEQDTLNPVGVNCIRAFPGRGIRVWGARTLSSDPSWRYLNVRRLFNYVEKSIDNGTQWVVFEPNDMDLWGRVRRNVGAFLTRLWADGALFGASADEAFFVKCDAELNTEDVRDAGQLIVEIGIAPVKPAEFVIFRISQYSSAVGA
jgi:phage tail sheath protein FI